MLDSNGIRKVRRVDIPLFAEVQFSRPFHAAKEGKIIRVSGTFPGILVNLAIWARSKAAKEGRRGMETRVRGKRLDGNVG